MSCDRCSQLVSGHRIQSPSQLKEAVTMIARAIDFGIIDDVGPGSRGDPFPSLADESEWGEVVNNYFSCTRCNQAYQLRGRTYPDVSVIIEEVSGSE